MATVIYVMGDRRRALQELPLPEAGLKGREEVVCLQYVDLPIQLETGHKVAICPRRKLLYMWIYVIRDQKLLLRGDCDIFSKNPNKRNKDFFSRIKH